MLFNNSLSEGTFLECFKTAKIILIFKSADSNSTVNYRLISMLPFLTKIFEKLMCARLDSPPGGSEWIISVGDYVNNSFTALGSSDPREVRLEL